MKGSMKDRMVRLISIALLLGWCSAASAQEFQIEQRIESAQVFAVSTAGVRISLNVQRIRTPIGEGETDVGTVFVTIARQTFFRVVPAGDIQIDFEAGRAVVNTMAPNLGRVNVTWQATGGMTSSEFQSETDAATGQSEFRIETVSKAANNVQGSVGAVSIGRVLVGSVSKAEAASQFQFGPQ